MYRTFRVPQAPMHPAIHHRSPIDTTRHFPRRVPEMVSSAQHSTQHPQPNLGSDLEPKQSLERKRSFNSSLTEMFCVSSLPSAKVFEDEFNRSCPRRSCHPCPRRSCSQHSYRRCPRRSSPLHSCPQSSTLLPSILLSPLISTLLQPPLATYHRPRPQPHDYLYRPPPTLLFVSIPLLFSFFATTFLTTSSSSTTSSSTVSFLHCLHLSIASSVVTPTRLPLVLTSLCCLCWLISACLLLLTVRFLHPLACLWYTVLTFHQIN